MDLLNELNTKREDYSQALTQNQNDLVETRSVLAKLKEQYDIDKPVIDRLESEDKVLIEKQKSTGIKIEVLANKVEELKRSRSHPTAEMVDAIKDALKHFEII